MKEVLYQDNWRFLQRAPVALESKFQRMAEDPYTFMRGNLSIQVAHWSRVSQDRMATSFLQTPESTMVPIFGDAHPENLTICAYPDQPTTVEIIDLDAASYGPWIVDVRRSLTAQRIFAASMVGCEEDCQEQVVLGWLSGFWSRLHGEQIDLLNGRIVGDLIDEALDEGGTSKKYFKYTTDAMLDRDDELDSEGKGIFSIEQWDTAPLEIFEEFANSREGTTRMLDVAQRFGMGISSHAALRYVYVWDEGLDGEEDNRLLLAREVFDPPNYPGKLGITNEIFESNAHRVDAFRSELWNNRNADPNYSGQDHIFSYKTQTWTSYFQDIEVHKIQDDWNDGKYAEQDLIDVAIIMGALNAQIATRSRTLNGQNVHQVIIEDIELGGGESIFFEEMVESALIEHQQQQEDYEWFVDELNHSGPLLGLDVMEEW